MLRRALSGSPAHNFPLRKRARTTEIAITASNDGWDNVPLEQLLSNLKNDDTVEISNDRPSQNEEADIVIDDNRYWLQRFNWNGVTPKKQEQSPLARCLPGHGLGCCCAQCNAFRKGQYIDEQKSVGNHAYFLCLIASEDGAIIEFRTKCQTCGNP